MFERFTDRSRKVMAHANQEAQRLGHSHIGTGHMLLGLVREGTGVGAAVLKNLGVDLGEVQQEVCKRIQPGSAERNTAKLPMQPEVKTVFKHATDEARSFKHNYVGTEHLLLGLLHQEDSIAGQVLAALGLDLNKVRLQTRELLGQAEQSEAAGPMDVKNQAVRQLLDREATLSATISAAAAHLDPDKPVTPGRMILALIKADSALAARLATVMQDIRKACA